jgi:hypothetical protein
VLPKRTPALHAALPVEAYGRRVTPGDIADGQAGRFLRARSGVLEKQQQGVIAPSSRRLLIWYLQQRIDLRRIEVS